MPSFHHYSASASFFFFFLMPFFSLFSLSFCFNVKHLELTRSGSHWSQAGASWYGSRDGAGSTGGACGYGNAVELAPFSSLIAAGGPSLFKSGKGCGTCYQVKCSDNDACSEKPVTVVITDECPGCLSESAHFDLSGTAFGDMAISGKADQLRDAGVLKIQYARVACEYPGKKLAFHVDSGSNSNYLSVIVEFEDGDGDLASVDLKQGSLDSGEWVRMVQLWGADWKLDAGSELRPPFSLRLTSQYSGKTLVARNVIPVGWLPGATYRSVLNYD